MKAPISTSPTTMPTKGSVVPWIEQITAIEIDPKK